MRQQKLIADAKKLGDKIFNAAYGLFGVVIFIFLVFLGFIVISWLIPLDYTEGEGQLELINHETGKPGVVIDSYMQVYEVRTGGFSIENEYRIIRANSADKLFTFDRCIIKPYKNVNTCTDVYGNSLTFEIYSPPEYVRY